MSPESELVILGHVVKPFGRMGEVKVLLETDYPEVFAERKQYILTRDQVEGVLMDVESVRFHKGAALIKFRGVDSIENAEELRGVLLAVPMSERAELPSGKFWVDDIIGAEAFLEDGRSLGVISEVMRGKSNDVWVTPKALIPALGDMVVSVDIEARKVVVRAVEGLTLEDL